MKCKSSINFLSKSILIFIFLSLPLFSDSLDEHKNVNIYDCNNKRIFSKDNVVAWDILRALNEAMEKVKNCLPKKYSKLILNYLKSKKIIIFLDCTRNTPKCGETLQSFRKGLYITLFYDSIYIRGACGCVEATILHELLHWGAEVSERREDERKAYGCEEKCFPDCAKDREGAKPDDCCDN